MRPRIAALAAAALLATSFAAPARADLTQPTGSLCEWVGIDDSVVFTAGPLTLTDEDGAAVHVASVTCSIQEGPTHAAPDWVSATGTPTPSVAVLPPTAVPRPGPWPWFFSYCTQIDVVGGPTLYWHDPDDRNMVGWWTTDPAARCASSTETADLRQSDPPGRYVWSSLSTAFGEAEPAAAAVEEVACPEPALGPVLDLVWACGVPSQMTSVSFVRVPGAAVVRNAPPFGWACTDVHSGLPVTRGSLLTTPDPGLSCVPAPDRDAYCVWVQVSGVLVPATLGRVSVTNACGSSSVTRQLTPAQGAVAEVWSGSYYGGGRPPWRCTADEDTTVEPAYVVLCNIV